MKQIVLFLALLQPLWAFAQVEESFSGSSITSNNPWKGDLERFRLTSNGSLEFVSPKGKAGEATLRLPVPFTENMVWDIDLKMDKSTSSNNLRIYVYTGDYIKVYIQAGSNNGQVSLYLNDGSASPKMLVKGRSDLMSKEEKHIRSVSIRLTLEDGHIWTLYTRGKEEKGFVKEGVADLLFGNKTSLSEFSLNFRYIQSRVSNYYVDHIKITYDDDDEGNDSAPGSFSDVALVDVEQPTSDVLRFIFDGNVDISEASCSIEGMDDVLPVGYGKNRTIVEVRLPETLDEKNTYYLTWEGLRDMEGRWLEEFTLEITFGDGEEATEPEIPVGPPTGTVQPEEIVFNELLPNPFAGGSEYIELYNRSNRDLPINGLAISTRKTDGTLSTAYPLSGIVQVMEKEAYLLLTKSTEGVSDFYAIYSHEALHELKLPVLVNTSSTLVLYRMDDGVVIDEVAYSSKWHASSIKDQKGVALERINPESSTQDAKNWTSATERSGYGTPGYKNSQYGNDEDDGKADGNNVGTPAANESGSYTITYSLNEPGYSWRAYIYSINGSRVAEIANNEQLAQSGEIVWDGRGLDGRRLQTGMYIFYAELYNAKGGRKQIKRVFLAK